MRVRERKREKGERNRKRERNLVAERGEKKALGFLTAAQPVCGLSKKSFSFSHSPSISFTGDREK